MSAVTQLPGLARGVDPYVIAERVNELIKDYNSGRVEDLAQALIDIAVLQAAANTGATTFLAGANVALGNGSMTNVVNTGSIGSSGQVWLIIGTLVGISTGGATVITGDIRDGSSVVASAEAVSPAANQAETVLVTVVVTLSAPTTFTLRGAGNNATTFALRSTISGLGTSDKMTSITAVRLS